MSASHLRIVCAMILNGWKYAQLPIATASAFFFFIIAWSKANVGKRKTILVVIAIDVNAWIDCVVVRSTDLLDANYVHAHCRSMICADTKAMKAAYRMP